MFTVFDAIQQERLVQDARWGEQNHGELKWSAILTEEVGEVARAVNELTPTKGNVSGGRVGQTLLLRRELIQVAAVCVAWLECLERFDRGEVRDADPT